MVAIVHNISTVLQELHLALQKDHRTAEMTITRMAAANTNAGTSVNGWVGLYVDTVDYEPRIVGAGARQWRSKPVFRIIVQATDLYGPEQAHDKLEGFLQNVLDVVLENRTLGETMGTLNSMNVTYTFNEDDRESMHFIGALVTLGFEGTTN